jgi:hypothetical protein
MPHAALFETLGTYSEIMKYDFGAAQRDRRLIVNANWKVYVDNHLRATIPAAPRPVPRDRYPGYRWIRSVIILAICADPPVDAG